MLGIEFKWECPVCGNVLRTKEPFWTKKLRKAAVGEEPKKCGCGRTKDFQLINFEQCQFGIEKKDKDEDREPARYDSETSDNATTTTNEEAEESA